MKLENLVFLDTETTGRGPEDRLCQVAYKFEGKEFECFFKPPVPIQIEAMAVTHITEKTVADKEPFIGSKMQKKLQEIFSVGNILVAHNAEFDAGMLRREGMDIKKENIIDTHKVVQAFDQNAEIPRYSLQYLRYYFDLVVENALSHNALDDVRVLEKLFHYLYGKMSSEKAKEEEIIAKMLDISAKPVFIKKFGFGKYKGRLVGEIALENLGYLRWLLDEKIKARDEGGEDDKDWIATLEHYLK